MIALGEHDLENPTDGVMRRGVEKIILHEDYDRNLQGGAAPNDIALIRVNESIPLHDEDPKLSNVRPICLPWSINDPGRELVDGDILKVLGWGRVTNDNRDFLSIKSLGAASAVLQQLDVPYVSNKKCNEYDGYKNNIFLMSSQICTEGVEGLSIDLLPTH